MYAVCGVCAFVHAVRDACWFARSVCMYIVHAVCMMCVDACGMFFM